MNIKYFPAISAFFFICLVPITIKLLALQEKVDRHEKVILACINEHPFIFKADNEKDSVVIMCKRF